MWSYRTKIKIYLAPFKNHVSPVYFKVSFIKKAIIFLVFMKTYNLRVGKNDPVLISLL